MADPKTVELQAGDVIDQRYRVTGRIGHGGMGTVYEAEQITLGRPVALKVLRPEYADKEKAAKRFEREAKAASSIDHRNVVKIHDFGHLPSGELYYAMERLQGQDLAVLLREAGALPWSRAGWITLQIVRAFGAIHGQGIVHRDIKPANCFLMEPKAGDEPDFIKILDFGIANLQHDRVKGTELTGDADIVGTVTYMAPEQIRSDAVDERTDIYSLGVMMYELLTGAAPFVGDKRIDVMIGHTKDAPRPPREVVPEIPPEVEAIVLQAMAKAPQDRFQSMAQMEAALLPLVEIPGTLGGGTSPRLVTASMSFAGPSTKRRRPGWVLPVVAALLFVGAIGVTRWLKSSGGDDQVAQADDEASASDASPVPADGKEPEPGAASAVVPPPPPEEAYDPFSDPFGAPSLTGRTIARPTAGDDSGEGETDGIPTEEVPLEDILPEGVWELERGTISGNVRNDRGRPAGKANVCAWMVDPRAPVEMRKRPVCARTDGRGRFMLSDVRPGLLDVHVFKNKFVPQSYAALHDYPLVLNPGAELEDVEFTLEPGGAELRGTVKDKLGDPVRGAKVAVVGGPRTLAVADGSGAFSLWVASDEVDVVAWREGYSDVVAKGRVAEPLGIVLRIQSKILGVVVDADTREPVAGARVRAGREGAGVSPLTYSNADGEFTISSLSEGRYRPTARNDEAYGAHERVLEVQEGTIPPEITLAIKRFSVVSEPEPEVIEEGTTGDEGDTDGTGTSTGTGTGTGSSTGTGTSGDSSGTTGDEDDAGSSTGGEEMAGDDEPVAAASPDVTEPTAAVEEPPKPKPPSDRDLKRRLAKKIKKCGTDGTVEIKAKLVVASGELLQESVKVKGAAAKDPSVKACAEAHVAKFKLTRRKEPSTFKTMVVTLK